MMRDKLGLFGEDKNDRQLIDDLLNWMEKHMIDYTNTFCHLMEIKIDGNTYKNEAFKTWFDEWLSLIHISEPRDATLSRMPSSA